MGIVSGRPAAGKEKARSLISNTLACVHRRHGTGDILGGYRR